MINTSILFHFLILLPITLSSFNILSSTELKTEINISQCKETNKNASAIAFWTWQAHDQIGKIIDTQEMRIWKTKKSPDRCHQTSLSDINNDLNRTEGYMIALSDISRRLPNSVKELSEDIDKHKEIKLLESLTGKHFRTKTEFDKWWNDNKDYLIWSESKNSLVVDVNAKKMASQLLTKLQIP